MDSIQIKKISSQSHTNNDFQNSINLETNGSYFLNWTNNCHCIEFLQDVDLLLRFVFYKNLTLKMFDLLQRLSKR